MGNKSYAYEHVSRSTFLQRTSRNFRQLFIRREIQLVKGHNKYATPSTGFQSAYFAMKKIRWIPASGKETFDSSLYNDHTLGMKPQATVCSFMKQDLKSNLTVQFIMYCTVACLHSTRIINLRVNQNIIYTGRAPRIMYRNAAVQRRPLQPSVSKPIYRGYLGCKKRVEKNPRRVCELNSKR